MAGKRKSRYRNVLTKPIQLQRPELGLWLREDEIRRQAEGVWLENLDLLKADYGIGAEDPEQWQKLALCLVSDYVRERLGAFLKSYGIGAKDPKYWQGLAICLACDHVLGLKILPPKAGRPRTWDIGLAQEFVRTVDNLKKSRHRLKDAVRKAAKKMGIPSRAAGTLQNLYRRSKEMIQPRPGTPLGCELDRVDDPRLKRLDEPQ